MYALLGNASAVEVRRDDDDNEVRRDIDGERVTEFRFPEGLSLTEALLAVRDAWSYHTRLDDDGIPDKPSWVESDSEGLAALIAEEYGCPVGAPAGWGETNED